MHEFNFSLIQNITLGFLTLLIPLGFEVFKKNRKEYADIFDLRVIERLLECWWVIAATLFIGLVFPVICEIVNVELIELDRWGFILLTIVLFYLCGRVVFLIGKFLLYKGYRENLLIDIVKEEKDSKFVRDFWNKYWSREVEIEQLFLGKGEHEFWKIFVTKIDELFENKKYQEISDMLNVFWANFDKRNNYIWNSSEFIKQIFDWRMRTWDWFKDGKGESILEWSETDRMIDSICRDLIERSVGKEDLNYMVTWSFFKAIKEHFEENKDIVSGELSYVEYIFGHSFLPKLWEEIGKDKNHDNMRQAFPREWGWWNPKGEVTIINGWIRETALTFWQQNLSNRSVLSLLLGKAYNSKILANYLFLICYGGLITPKEVDEWSIQHFFEEEETAQYPFGLGNAMSFSGISKEDMSRARAEREENRRVGTLQAILDNPFLTTFWEKYSNDICENLDDVIKAFNSPLVKKVTKNKKYWELRRQEIIKLLEELKEQKKSRE